jgi:nucleoside-diphosphate-sugar epimerase
LSTSSPDEETGPSARQLEVLVTGSGARFLPGLAQALRARGHRVREIDSERAEVLPSAHTLPMPSDAPRVLREAVAAAEVTILLSGVGHAAAKVEDAAALQVILAAARPGSALVVTSSLAVFGDLGGADVDESSVPVVPAGLESLRGIEVRTLAADNWLRPVLVRTGLVYGPGGGLVLRAAIDRARLEGVGRYLGERDDLYPLVHTDDLVTLLVTVSENDAVRGVVHAVTARCTAGVLASLVADLAGVDRVEPGARQWLWTPLPLGTPPPRVNHHACTSRAGRIGWTPTAPSLGSELAKMS